MGDFHRKLYESPYVYEKEVPQAYCESCKTFLADRFVLGKCPKCGSNLSASRVAAGGNTYAFSELWGEDARHYYVHGKDNIPFHTIILPALLLGNGEAWHLPGQIVSGEYLILEGRKISTSRNYAIWVKDLLDNYEADSIRYFFIANGPEKNCYNLFVCSGD